MLQSSSSEKKKWVKPLKNCFIGPNLHKKGVIMGHAQRGKQFFWAEITKVLARSKMINLDVVWPICWVSCVWSKILNASGELSDEFKTAFYPLLG